MEGIYDDNDEEQRQRTAAKTCGRGILLRGMDGLAR